MGRTRVLIAAVLLFVAAGCAGKAPTRSFDVTWETNQSDLLVPAQTRTGNGPLGFTIPIEAHNLTRLHFTFTIRADGARANAQTVDADFDPPMGVPVMNKNVLFPASPQNELTFQHIYELADTPNATTVDAQDAERAFAELTKAFGSDLGHGTWLLNMTFRMSNEPPVRPVYTVSGSVKVTAYAARLFERSTATD